MTRAIGRFLDVVRSVGAGRASLAAAAWLAARHYRVLTRDLGGDLPPIARPELVFRELEPTDDERLRKMNPLLTRAEIARRRREEQRCFCCSQGDLPIHYRWYATSPVELPFLGLGFVPASGDYTTVEAYTLPAMRGRGIHQALSIHGLHRARGLGLRRSVSFVAWWNSPALRAIEKLGFEHVGAVTRWTGGRVTTAGAVRMEAGSLRVEPK